VLGLALLVSTSCLEPARSADAPAPPRPPASQLSERPASDGAEADGSAALLADAAGAGAPEGAAPPASAAEAAPGPARVGQEDAFFDEPDAAWRESLLRQPPKRVERGRGGRSLGFKITLGDGRKGYFKANQTFSAANWFGEVAAYHLDRMLGLGRVPCVVSRELRWDELTEAAGDDPRRAEVIINDGKVRGAFVAWVSGGLMPLPETEGWERWLRVRYWPSSSVSPFQRPAVWKHQQDLVRKLGDNWRSKEERLRRRNLQPVPDREDRPAELSDLLVFDYLTRNMDRWGGVNANVLIRGSNGPLVFLDNGAAFEPSGVARPGLMEARLHVVQRFRRGTIASVRAFDVERFKARLATEAVQPVLNAAQIEGLLARRKALLEWVEEMERTHGAAIWAWE
jgi:hypothetical protein